jgi:hypothetical protein
VLSARLRLARSEDFVEQDFYGLYIRTKKSQDNDDHHDGGGRYTAMTSKDT